MKRLLTHPAIYQFYQELGGFFAARVEAIREYLPIAPGARIIDIGCGPGYIVRHLPAAIDYVGLDIDRPSIDFANARFGDRGKFQTRFFDAAAVEDLGPADIVMMNGVMHHIGDADLAATLAHVRAVLRPGGTLYLSWRVTPEADRRDGDGRLYAAFDASVVRAALGAATVLHDQESVSASSAKVIHRIIARV